MDGKFDLSPEALNELRKQVESANPPENLSFGCLDDFVSKYRIFENLFTPCVAVAMIDEIERLRFENAGYKAACESTDIFLNAVIHHCKKNWDSALKERIEALTRDNKQLDEAYKAARAILDKENQELRAKVERLEKEADWLAGNLNELDEMLDEFAREKIGLKFPCDILNECAVPDRSCVGCWREAASKAVTEQENNAKQNR